MRILKWLFIFCCMFNVSKIESQWCCLDSTLQILDESTVSLRLLISGALNNNLASPDQGLCGVRIKFEHQFIGDLTVDLISPSGQRVRLIGPIGNSGNSSFSKWFVSFVPCTSPAIPDPGFKKKWDNIQSWGILGKFYSGTYHPQNGCLEDFNLGSVDGLWTLSVSDDQKFYQGKIESFCLLFCDQSGINCEDCSPNGGLFGNTILDYCLGDSRLSIIDTVLFPVFVPDTSYSYKYIISQNDTILDLMDKPDLGSYPVGDYLVCGVSFLRSDSFKLPVVGQQVSVFRSDLVLNQNGFCAELSKNCLQISIHPNYTGIIQNINLCKGDSIQVGNKFYDQTGVYNIPFTSTYGCDSSIVLNLDVIDLEIISGNIDTLDCLNKTVSIDLSNSLKTTNTIIQWSTSNGNFNDLTDPLKPIIDKEGDYKVFLTDGLCLDSAEFTVYKKDDIPDLIVTTDTLNCFNTVVNVIAYSNVLNPAFNWSNGSIDLGTDSLIQVNTPGFYHVTITDGNGCTNFSSIQVIANTSIPQLLLSAGELSCRDTFTLLDFVADLEIIDLIWQGPNLFMSKVNSPTVNDSGMYQLSVRAKNGCQSTDSIFVNTIKQIPDYFVNPETLKCSNNRMIILNAGSNFIIDSIVYTSPAGFYSNVLMPVISEPGLYLVKLTDTAGCTLDTFVNIEIDTSTARFSLSSILLDCVNDSVQLLLKYISTDTINTYLWTGPPGFNPGIQSPFAKEVGTYTVTVTSANGCTATDTITVMQDSQKPNILLATGQLDCNVSAVVINATVSNIIRFQWSGPNGFLSIVEDPLVQDSGIYKLIVTAANGCTSEKSIEVIEDKNTPINSIVGGFLNCKADSVLVKLIKNGLIDSIIWSGPANFKSSLDSFYTRNAGMYKVTVKGKNGCTDSSLIDIGYDTIPPKLTLIADTLTCKKPDANIVINTLDTALLYFWLTPIGDSIYSKDISVVNPGWYTVLATAQNGCSALDSIEVVDKRNNPNFQFLADSIICSDSIADLRIITNDLNINYLWSGPNGFNSTDSSIQAIIPGWYYYTITNAFNCLVKDSFLVNAYLQKPRISYSDSVFNCVTIANPVLTANLIDSLDLFEWILPSGLAIQNRSILASQAGTYIFRGENIYGCTVNDTLQIVFDTVIPVINNIYIDSLTCSQIQVVPLVESIPPGMDYNWKGPGNFSSQLPNPVLTVSGVYSLTITASNFCTTDTVMTLVMDTISPIIQTIGGEITCVNFSVTLDVLSADSLSSVIWTSPIGTILNQRQPMVADTGWYIVIVKGLNDCLAFDSAYVSRNISPPVINKKNGLIPCNPDSTQLEITSSDTASSYMWNGPNGFTSTLKNPFVRDTGFYQIEVTGTNLCKTTDIIRVDFNRSIPSLDAIGGMITCKDSTVQLKAIFDISGVQFKWSAIGFVDSSQISPFVLVPGFYNIMIVDSLGCMNDTTVEVGLDTMKPLIQIAALDSLICEQKIVRLANSISCSNCMYQWSTQNGIIHSNQTKDSVFVNGEGNYSLQVEDRTNGCISIQNFNLLEIISSLRGLNVQIISPTCFGLDDGQLLFDSILGGVPPYKISFDGTKFNDLIDQNNLNQGTFSLFIKDKYGCLYDTVINIIGPNPLLLSLGRDTTIPLGQLYPIFPSSNANTALLQLISWDPPQDLDCNNCFNVVSSPKSTIHYVLKIIDENGCIAEDDIVISIIDKPRIFVPNTFSPNHDEINDYFTIVSGGDPIMVQSFQVFDRWGNLLISKEGIEVIDQYNLWDGTYNGELMSPGVYVYKIEFKLASGKDFIQAGDLNLIR